MSSKDVNRANIPKRSITEARGIRLVGGAHPMEGRVEIHINGAWSTICGDEWDDREAQMVCRELTPYPFDG